MPRALAPIALAFAALAFLAPAARAQEAMYTEAATMPGPRVAVLRQMLHLSYYGADARAGTARTRQLESLTSLQYGLVRDWSLRLDVPVALRRDDLAAGGRDRDQGVEDLELMAKWRVYRLDTGGIDTLRVALMGGATFASGDDSDFSSQSVNPSLGAVLTLIRGRHGLNQELTYRVQTGGEAMHNFGGKSTDDVLFFNTAYVFRLWPERFTADSTGGWYTTAEFLGIYETNGDVEGRGSLGLMYEGTTFAVEGGVLLPIFDRLRHRAELDLGVSVGVRFTF